MILFHLILFNKVFFYSILKLKQTEYNRQITILQIINMTVHLFEENQTDELSLCLENYVSTEFSKKSLTFTQCQALK